MKFNKMMFAALAFSALAMFSCKQKPDDPVGPVGPGGGGDDPQPTLDIPEVAAPAAGLVTIVINIPANSECNGIAFKGNLDGDDTHWSGKDTYVSETTAQAPVADCIKFAPVPNAANWYQATFKLGEIGLKGKVCLIYKGDNNWQGQATNVELIDDYTTAEVKYDGGEANIEITKGGLVYLKIGGWQKSECAAAKLTPRKITLIAPTNTCGFSTPTVVGTFNNWDPKEFPMNKVAGKENVFELTIQAEDADKFKFGSVDGWESQIDAFDAANDGYMDGNPDIEIGAKTEFEVDYSKGKYKSCTE